DRMPTLVRAEGSRIRADTGGGSYHEEASIRFHGWSHQEEHNKDFCVAVSQLARNDALRKALHVFVIARSQLGRRLSLAKPKDHNPRRRKEEIASLCSQ
ncbi:MAG: hypothetical protein V3V46_00600, partial [Anaerolineales bacterium]